MYICVGIYIYVCMYVYVYIEREKETYRYLRQGAPSIGGECPADTSAKARSHHL